YREVEAELQKVVDELYRIRADEQPRPLTARDITDEMTDRAYDWGEEDSLVPRTGMRAMLAAALTEPPARPEGAEKVEEERDEARRYECSDPDAHWRLGEALASLKEANATVASLRAEQPRPLTADDIEQLVTQ